MKHDHLIIKTIKKPTVYYYIFQISNMPKEKTARKIRSCPACPGVQYKNIYTHIQRTHRLHPPSNRRIKKKSVEQEFARTLANTLKNNNFEQAKLLLRQIEDNIPEKKDVKCIICKNHCVIRVTGFYRHLSIFHSFKNILEETKATKADMMTNVCEEGKFPSDNDSNQLDNPVFSSPLLFLPQLEPTTQLITGLKTYPGKVSGISQKFSFRSLSQLSETKESADTAIVLSKTNSLPELSKCGISKNKCRRNVSMPPSQSSRAEFDSGSSDFGTQAGSSIILTQPNCVASVNEAPDQETNDTKECLQPTLEVTSIATDSTATQVQENNICLQVKVNESNESEEIDAMKLCDENTQNMKCSFVWETPPDTPNPFDSMLVLCPQLKVCSSQVQCVDEKLHFENAETQMETHVPIQKEVNLKCCACLGSISFDLEKHTHRKHQIINHDAQSTTLMEAIKTNDVMEARRLIKSVLNSLPDEKKVQCNYCNHEVDIYLFENHLSDFHKLSQLMAAESISDASESLKIKPEVIDLTQDDDERLEVTFETNWLNSKTFDGYRSKQILSAVKTEIITEIDLFETPPGSPEQFNFSYLKNDSINLTPPSFGSFKSTDDSHPFKDMFCGETETDNNSTSINPVTPLDMKSSSEKIKENTSFFIGRRNSRATTQRSVDESNCFPGNGPSLKRRR